MSRLLFAAARGACIEEAFHLADGIQWIPCNVVYTDGSYPDEHRIHPDDKHLQYGPISTAMRALAVETHPPLGNVFYDSCAAAYAMFLKPNGFRDYEYSGEELHRSLFLLILSEALADEGL